MDQTGITRRDLLIGTAVLVAAISFQGAHAAPISNPLQTKESSMTTREYRPLQENRTAGMATGFLERNR